MQRIYLQQATLTLALSLWLVALLTISGFFYSTHRLDHFAAKKIQPQVAQKSVAKKVEV